MPHHTAWDATTEPPALQALQGDEEADVVVVGGGITGVTAAYLLARDGRSVVLVDQQRIGAGMTGHTTAHLTVIQDHPFIEYERRHGRDAAVRFGQGQMEAIALMERLVADHEIPCDFARIDGHLVDTADMLAGNDLMREMNLLHEMGLDAVEPFETGSVPIMPGGRGLRVPDQARLHALRYLYGLLRAAQDKGVRAYDQTHVGRIGEDRVETDQGTIRAKAIVLATHTPAGAKQLALKLHPCTTYVIAAPVARGTLPDGLYWDTEEPYHYVRLQPWQDDQDLVIIGGADHRTGAIPDGGSEARYDRLHGWALRRIPTLGPVALRWSGQVFDPADALPYVGRSPDHKGNVYAATGFSGNGTTNGTLAAMVLADLVAGRRSPWADLLRPDRKKDLVTKESLTHNLGAAKHLVLDRLRPSDIKDVAELRPGTGAVIARGLSHEAVYRHEDGRVERHSAICTHMGCVVSWNAADASFDCPCHGSRFGTDGRVLSGPALAPLKPMERQEEKADNRSR